MHANTKDNIIFTMHSMAVNPKGPNTIIESTQNLWTHRHIPISRLVIRSLAMAEKKIGPCTKMI